MGKIKYVKVNCKSLGQPGNDVVDHLKKKQEKRKFKDTGDYVDGSAKERAAMRALVNSTDLMRLESDEATAISMVVKDNVWPPYDFEAEKENGVAPSWVYFRNELRKAFPPKPIKDNADMRRVYVKTAEYLQWELSRLRYFPSNIQEYFRWLFLGFDGLKAFTTGHQLAYEIQQKLKYNSLLQEYREEADDIERFVERHYTIIEDFFNHRYMAVYFLRDAMKDNFGKGRFMNIVTFSPVKTINELAGKSLKIEADDWSWAETKKRGETTKSDNIEINTGVPLSYIKRKGGLMVDDGDVTEHTLTESLGFRAVQLGHAITDKELAQHIRHFICSITDLGEALDLDMQRTHEFGELAIAFAARGKSKAMAHYETLRKIINLTRSRGDGSVAHEWGHFFDHLIARGMKLTTGKLGSDIFVYNNKQRRLDHNTTLRAENITQVRDVCDKLQEIHKYIFKGKGYTTITKKFYAKDAKTTYGFNYGKNTEEAVDNLRNGYINYFIFPFKNANSVQVLSSIAKHHNVPFIEVELKLHGLSRYYYESLGYGSKYWASPVELFARAFECFVFDALAEKGMENNYLVSGGYFNRSVYPQGVERIELNGLFRNLVDEARKLLTLGHFVPRTDARVDEFIELDDKGDAKEGTVFVDENADSPKETKKLKNKKTKNTGVALALALALQIEMEMEFEFDDAKPAADNPTTNQPKPMGNGREMDFVNQMRQEINLKVKHNKTSVEKIAKNFGIDNQNKTKELTELAIVLEARKIAEDNHLTIRERYDAIVELYKSQVNLSHRTSMSILMQQYSTAAPISYLAGLWVKSTHPDAQYFEPSAGNGLLCHALPYHSTVVNELDDTRLANLNAQPFKTLTSRDASLPFGYGKIFDGVLTNPPFDDLEQTAVIEEFHIKKLEHLMTIRALETMKDDGRAAIIVGGHTRYDDASGVITNKGDRYFLNYLYHFFNVVDIVPIDGHNLYSRQGTAYDTRLILIDGRKETPSGIADYSPIEGRTNAHLRQVVLTFDELFERIVNADIEHFMKLSKSKGEPQKRFKPKDKVSFIGAGSLVCTGQVMRYMGEGKVEVFYNKTAIVLPVNHLTPALQSCSIEKPSGGYKAFKSLAQRDKKSWRATFIDGESIHITRAFSNKEAQAMAIRERLKRN